MVAVGEVAFLPDFQLHGFPITTQGTTHKKEESNHNVGVNTYTKVSVRVVTEHTDIFFCAQDAATLAPWKDSASSKSHLQILF